MAMNARFHILHVGAMLTLLTVLSPVGCGGDDEDEGTGGTGGRPENTGAACEAPADCYPEVEDTATIEGEVQCLDRIDEGYCTHFCQDDADCCAVEGECDDGYTQVCSPFESTGQKMCFVSCEPDQLNGATEQDYCRDNASPDFICRSSGGGGDNRKICVPGDCGVGESCSEDAQCATDLVCITGYKGGYCGVRDCTVNADCPADSSCVTAGDGKNYCFRNCTAEGDCRFCRPDDVVATCSDAVTYAEAGTTGSVCVPPPKD
jgi:hypothetical protein